MPRSIRLSLCLAAVIAVTIAPCCAEEAGVPAGEHVQPLERLPPSPTLLRPPVGLSGDFAIANEPPAIDFAYFPNQWAGARLWSSWGDALCAADGSFYASIGDHDAPHGTAYVYRIDPESPALKLVVDYNTVIGADDKTRYSPGKIHGNLVEADAGRIYFIGYRGSEGQTTTAAGYRGDWLLRHDPRTGRTENLGIPIPDCSVPVLLHHAGTESLYGLAVPGQTAADPTHRFFRFTIDGAKPLGDGGPLPNIARALILADDGRAWYSHRNAAGQDVLVRYDPQSQKLTETAAHVPGGGQLRAASRPDPAGIVYCITADGLLFTFDTKDESIEELMPVFTAPPLYTATCRLDAAGRYLYYLPGAHGGGRGIGTPIVQYDTRTRRRKVIAFLSDYLREERDYNPGGTYGIALSADGSRLFVNLNGAAVGSKESDFGRCAAVVVHIPADDRRTE